MNKHTVNGVVKRALLYSAPFLLISAAIFLVLMWGLESFVEGNIYYRLVTLAPDLEEDSDGNLLVLDENKKEDLKDNNEGEAFVVPAEFPAIALGEQWATITIESADVWEVPVYHGDNSDNLWKGIGHYANSRFPGQHGKVVLAGHVGIYEFFQRLETMSVGDIVKLDTIYGEYVYQVVETTVFDQSDKSLLLPEAVDSGDKLICYTCYPYHTTSVRTQRFAIICELVSGRDWTVTDGDSGDPSAAVSEGIGGEAEE